MDNGESHSFDPYFGWGLLTKCCRSPSQAQAKADGGHLYLYYRMEHLSIESRRSARISIAPCNSRSTLLEQMYSTIQKQTHQIKFIDTELPSQNHRSTNESDPLKQIPQKRQTDPIVLLDLGSPFEPGGLVGPVAVCPASLQTSHCLGHKRR